MKKYLAFITWLILACSLVAQEKYPLPVFTIKGSEQMTTLYQQEQLNASLASLTKAKTMKTIGVLMTLAGGVTFITGLAHYNNLYGQYKEPPDGEIKTAGAMIAVGAGLTVVGINLWARGGHKKKRIEAQIKKFNGSATAYGVGMKISF